MGSANGYPQATPILTDEVVGIDDPAGAWSVKNFTLAAIRTLLQANFTNIVGTDITLGGGTALANYLEGTFTPVVIGLSTTGAGTYSTQTGTYTRIGNRVLFNIELVWSAHTGTGNMAIAGLPLAAAGNEAVAARNSGITLSANNVLQCFMASGSAAVSVQQYPHGGGSATPVPIDTNASLFLAGQYAV